MSTTVSVGARLRRVAARIAGVVAIGLTACKAPPVVPLPKPQASAAAQAPAARLPTTLPAAPTNTAAAPPPDAVPVPVVLRKALPGRELSTRFCGVATGATLAVVRRNAQGSLALQLVAPTGATQVGGSVQLAEPPTATAHLHCDAGGGKVWAWSGDGRELAVFDSSHAALTRLSRAVIGVVGQTDGSAVILPLSVGDAADLARLNPDFSPRWQATVPLPGPLAAMSATLRSDVLLLGKSASGKPQWWLSRIFAGDGKQLWVRRIDAKLVAPDIVPAALVAAPDGAVLFGEAGHAGPNAGKWLAYPIDANGSVRPAVELPQHAPRMVATGGEARVLWAQGRGQGVVVNRLVAGEELFSAAAPWPGMENPESLAVATDGAWWAVSQAEDPDGLGATGLVARWQPRIASQAAITADAACIATMTANGHSGPGPAQKVALQDGAACGPGAYCQAGLCRKPDKN